MFKFEPLAIPEVILITPEIHRDSRGVFAEVFKSSAFTAAGLVHQFVQENLSRSQNGVIRGMHYQLEPVVQVKLISGHVWSSV